MADAAVARGRSPDHHALLLYGTVEPLPLSRALQAGPLAVCLRGARLWNLRCGDAEVWHGLNFTFRDTEWGTPEPVIGTLAVDVAEDSFRVSLAARFPIAPLAIPFTLELEGRADGSLDLVAQATLPVDIRTNRFGLCLLHPPSACGRRVVVEHVDGRESHSTFPTDVPPWPPFTLIRAIRHEYAPGLWARCLLEGDSFELEDQRNNSDASFKTYSRTNMAPRPYVLRAGTTVRQAARLQLDPPPRRSVPVRGLAPIKVSAPGPLRPRPDLGIEIDPGDLAPGPAIRDALRTMHLSHLHMRVPHAGGVDWSGLARLLSDVGAGLRLDVSLADRGREDHSCLALARQLHEANIVPNALAAFPSEPSCLGALRHAFPGVPVGAGTEHFFVQLRRAEGLGAGDFLTFTTAANVHGTGEDEVMLTLQALPSMVETLRKSHPQPIRIGPSSIGARSSPLGRQPCGHGTHRMALAQNDPRCRGLFGAVWVLGYVAACVRAGVEAVTLMDLNGPSGVMQPGEQAVTRFPTFFALSRLGAATQVRELAISEPTRVTGLTLHGNGPPELMLGNLGPDPVDVDLSGFGAPGEIALMDAENWAAFTSCPVDAWTARRRPASSAVQTLGAYAVLAYSPGTCDRGP